MITSQHIAALSQLRTGRCRSTDHPRIVPGRGRDDLCGDGQYFPMVFFEFRSEWLQERITREDHTTREDDALGVHHTTNIDTCKEREDYRGYRG